MSYIEAIILGIVQGLTEFLPVSSSGHLVLLQKIMGIGEGSLSIDIALHLATLIPVFIVFRKDILGILRKPFGKLTWLLVVATIPAVIVALVLKDPIEHLFQTGTLLAKGFLFTALIILCSDIIRGEGKDSSNISFLDAIAIGLAQALAIFPAISRSGLTISAGIFRGLKREDAAKFSFLLSIIAILGAVTLDLPNLFNLLREGGESAVSIGPLLIGMIFAALSGFLAIKLVLKLLSLKKFKYFSVYLCVLALGIIIDQIFLHIIQ